MFICNISETYTRWVMEVIISQKIRNKNAALTVSLKKKRLQRSGRNVESHIVQEKIELWKPGFFSDAAWCILNGKVTAKLTGTDVTNICMLCLNFPLYYFWVQWLKKKSYGQWFSNKQILDSQSVNHLKTRRRLLYLKTQSVPHCKHFSSRL